MRRVVVTGIGIVSPLGVGVSFPFSRLCLAQCGIKKIEKFDVSSFPSKIGAFVPFGSEEGEFEREKYVPQNLRRASPLFADFALAASQIALSDASFTSPSLSPSPSPSSSSSSSSSSSLTSLSSLDTKRVGCVIGCGVGDLDAISDTSFSLSSRGYRSVSPYFVPGILLNMAPGLVAMAHQFHGPTGAPCMACASGNQAIIEAAEHIANDRADVCLAGGTEAAINALSLSGFGRMRALSTQFNDSPSQASRPFDAKRDGFVMGEGAAVLVLEEYEHALRRLSSSSIYAEVTGYGMATDAYHIAQPHPEGKGALDSMISSLEMAGKRGRKENKKESPSSQSLLSKEGENVMRKIGYINAHATSTPIGDQIEATVTSKIFENRDEPVVLGSTKGSTGHLLGAAGGIEAAFSCLALKKQIVPPSLNLENPDQSLSSSLCYAHPTKSVPTQLSAVMSNSFGFGGINTSVIFESLN